MLRPAACLVPIHSGKEVMPRGTNIIFVIVVQLFDRVAVKINR